MALFSFQRKPTLDVPVHHVLQANTHLHGSFAFSGGLLIHGEIDGAIEAKGPQSCVVVGKTGVVTTQRLQADTLILHGKVTATSIVGDRIVLSSTAQVTGDIQGGSVEIHNGACFEGRVSIPQNKPQDPAESREPAEVTFSLPGSAQTARSRLDAVVSRGTTVEAN